MNKTEYKTPQQLLDAVIDAGMTRQDVKDFMTDRRLGDPISPAEWLKAKELPMADRIKARDSRISVAKGDSIMDEYLNEKFEPAPSTAEK